MCLSAWIISHLRYFGIHFDRMLTYRKHVETTALTCKKGLSVLATMTEKGIEQRRLFLLYQSVVISVTDYGPGLTAMAQKNLLKLDRVQNEAMWLILGTTKDTPTETMRFMLDLAPTNANETESGAGQSILQCYRNSPWSTYELAMEDKKGCRLGRGQSWMGQTQDSVLQSFQLTEPKQT